jgi:Predicted nucleoside-diphosphate sugar epimerases
MITPIISGNLILLYNTAILGLCILIFQLLFSTYDSLWRYAEAQEYFMLFLGALCGYTCYFMISAFILKSTKLVQFYMLTVSVSSLLIHLAMRFTYRVLRKHRRSGKGSKNVKYIAIIGAGNAGASLLEEFLRNPMSPYEVWCFIDDDTQIIERKLHGVKIKGPINDISEILLDSPVSEIVLAIPSLSDERKQKIIDLCSGLPYSLKIVPDSILNVKSENVNISASIRDIRPDDLLGRSSISFAPDELRPFLEGKVILVTGGGGSIGSELCRQIATYGPKMIIIFEMFENSAYILKRDLDFICNGNPDVRVEIGSVRDEKRLSVLFDNYRPDVVFHAAAHKHVPLMENNPGEAVKNNIFGTNSLLRLSALYGCKKFVMISTDKAVNPTNVMGASKRYCEMMVQSMADIPGCETEFVAVRFGNVLGSNGSVVPLFMSQIEHGGPVTITDKRIIRYFMTISEAVSLVLKAGSMANKSEVYVLDMGKPVKILTLAENLIKLAGFVPYKDIQIIETGLRPGEKLYEELLIQEDTITATSSQRIFIEKQTGKIYYSDIERGLKLLNDAVSTEDNDVIVAALKTLVPTFKTPEEVNSGLQSVSEVKSVVSQTA